MRLLFASLGLAACLTACGQPTQPATTPTAAVTPKPSATLAPTALPSPTSLADGITIRMGTPDPSPNCPNHTPWFFANPVAECADLAANKWAALQHFEHGQMLWFQEQGETYILIDDGSPFKPYVQVADESGVANPTGPDPTLAPPAGLYQPLLGFAKFWRGLTPGSEWVRPTLGWATAPEADYSSFYQCNTNTGAAARCYLSGPKDEIIAFAKGPAAYWTYVKMPLP